MYLGSMWVYISVYNRRTYDVYGPLKGVYGCI